MNSKVKAKPAVWIKFYVFATVCTLVLSGCGTKVDDSDLTNAEEPVEDTLDPSSTDDLSYIKEYIAFAEEFQQENGSYENEYSKLGYNLIYLDDDNVPELVMGLNGYFVSLYTFIDGGIVTVMDKWPYGAGGNPGYEYLEKTGIVYNTNSDMAGAIMNYTYWEWNSENKELTQKYDSPLYVRYLNDLDGDGEFDYTGDGENIMTEIPVYYFGDSKISEEEFKSHQIEGEYKHIDGKLSFDELVEKLNSLM